MRNNRKTSVSSSHDIITLAGLGTDIEKGKWAQSLQIICTWSLPKKPMPFSSRVSSWIYLHPWNCLHSIVLQRWDENHQRVIMDFLAIWSLSFEFISLLPFSEIHLLTPSALDCPMCSVVNYIPPNSLCWQHWPVKPSGQSHPFPFGTPLFRHPGLQEADCWRTLLQAKPCGHWDGSVIVLVLVMVPPPHGLLHGDHGNHSLTQFAMQSSCCFISISSLEEWGNQSTFCSYSSFSNYVHWIKFIDNNTL